MRLNEITTQVWSGRPLSEMPQTVGANDFGMADENYRSQFTRYLLNVHPQQIPEDEPEYQLIRAGEGQRVYFFMLEQPHGRLVYFVKCETAKVNFIGQTVTQVALWRDFSSAVPVGVTGKVFEMLLSEWPTVMSDEEQTDRGREFWVQRMAICAAKGFKVGLADLREKTVEWRSADEPYADWIKARSGAWSKDHSAQNLRFLISK